MTIVESGGGDGPVRGEVVGCFKGEVVEVAPGAVSRENNFCVVWKVELEDVVS